MENVSKSKRLSTLFFSMLYISSCTFGGGFVIVSLMKKRFSDELGWIDEERMLDLASIAQSSPGAIAVNASILLGYECAGFVGSIVAAVATIIPPLAILSVISVFYNAFRQSSVIATLLRGMQAGVAAVVFDVACGLGGKIVCARQWFSVAIMAVAFVLSCVFSVNVIYIILGGIAIGVGRIVFNGRRAA